MEEGELQNEESENGIHTAGDFNVRVGEANDDRDTNQEITATELDAIRGGVENATALRDADFAKVEKSLASLGFFTPSSRRVKNQQVKRISFTRDIDGKRVEVTAEIIPSA